jgi:hypothetical protein
MVRSFGLGTTAAGRQPTGRGMKGARTILQAQQWIAVVGTVAASLTGQREYLLMMPAAADGDDDGVGAAGDRFVDSSAQDFAER